MAYPWANRLLFRAMGSPPPATAAVEVPAARPDRVEAHASAEDVGLLDQVDALWERADAQLPTWQTMTMRLPAREGAPVLFVMSDARSWNAFARSQLSLDAATGAVRQWAPYDASTLGQKARGWARYAHTGELGGLLAQILAGLACLGGVVLVWTGLGLSARRFLGWRPVRSRLRSSRSGLPAATRIG
jgi:uncharacterized iron-regulated membrane protein